MKDLKKLFNYDIAKLLLKFENNTASDFNFFLPYLGKKKKTKNIYIYGTLSIGILLFIFIGTFIYNTVKINKMQNEIAQMKKTLDSPVMQEKVKQADNLNKKYDILKKYYDGVNTISTAIDKKAVISSDLIRKISSQLPQSVSFKTMNIDAQNIQVQGTAGSRVNIAELEHNLKALDEIKDVQVVNINKNSANSADTNNTEATTGSNNYTFTLKCTLKDVDNNENK